MIRRAAVAATSLAAFALAGSAAAGSNDKKTCTASNSRSTTIEAIQSDFDTFFGKCVRLRGIRLADRVFASREALLEETALWGEGARHSLVVYPEGARGDRSHWVEIIGRIGSCRTANEEVHRLNAQRDGTVSWVSGYCHTSMANFVRPDRARTIATKPVPRLTEAEVAPERRELIAIPDASAVPQDHLNAARRLVTAILSGDEQQYFRLTEPGFERDLAEARGAKLPDWLRDRMAESRKEFREKVAVAQFRALGDWPRRPQETFVGQNELGGLARTDRRLIHCWCKTNDCRGRWPVLSLDADYDPARPYVCVFTYDYLTDGRYVVQGRAVSRRTTGLAEPNWKTDTRQ